MVTFILSALYISIAGFAWIYGSMFYEVWKRKKLL